MDALRGPVAPSPPALVTPDALAAFTSALVHNFAPEKVILFGSLSRGQARWDSDADILVIMPFEGRPLALMRDIRRVCRPEFPLDLLVRQPADIEKRYRWGDPIVREALDHGTLLHG